MLIRVRHPDGSIKDYEVTHWRATDFGRYPDPHAQFSDYLVLESLGPDEEGVSVTLVARTKA